MLNKILKIYGHKLAKPRPWVLQEIHMIQQLCLECHTPSTKSVPQRVCNGRNRKQEPKLFLAVINNELDKQSNNIKNQDMGNYVCLGQTKLASRVCTQ